MAEQHFSWLTESTLETVAPLPEEKNKLEEYKNSLKNMGQKLLLHKKTLIALGVLFLALILLKFYHKEEAPHFNRLESMAAVMPIPKGDIIEGMLLRPALVAPFSLSKNQKMELLLPADAEKIMGKLRAKKDIPPNKPIFWSDLEIIPLKKKTAKTTAPLITYPENEP